MRILLIVIFTIASLNSADAEIIPVPKEEKPEVEKKKPVEPVKKVEKELTPWEKCCANDIDLSPLRNGFFIDNYKKNRGNFNPTFPI